MIKEKDIARILNQVKDEINLGVYRNKKGYKWLQDRYTTFLLIQTIIDNDLNDTKEIMEYLETLIEILKKE